MNADFSISGKILAEINDGFSIGRFQKFPLKPFLLHNGYRIGTDKFFKAIISQDDPMPIRSLLHTGIVFFAFFQIVQADGAGLTCLPGTVRTYNHLPVPFQLAQKRQVGAVVVIQSIHTVVAPVPAVTQSNDDLIFAGAEQVSYVICLVLQPQSVIIRAGSQNEIPNTTSIQLRFVQAMASDVEPCFFDCRCLKFFPQHTGWLTPGFLMGKLWIYPTSLPAAIDKTHFKAGRCTFCTLPILIPEYYAPLYLFSGFSRWSAIANGHL